MAGFSCSNSNPTREQVTNRCDVAASLTRRVGVYTASGWRQPARPVGRRRDREMERARDGWSSFWTGRVSGPVEFLDESNLRTFRISGPRAMVQEFSIFARPISEKRPFFDFSDRDPRFRQNGPTNRLSLSAFRPRGLVPGSREAGNLLPGRMAGAARFSPYTLLRDQSPLVVSQVGCSVRQRAGGNRAVGRLNSRFGLWRVGLQDRPKNNFQFSSPLTQPLPQGERESR
jgi:hypothetical protein